MGFKETAWLPYKKMIVFLLCRGHLIVSSTCLKLTCKKSKQKSGNMSSLNHNDLVNNKLYIEMAGLIHISREFAFRENHTNLLKRDFDRLHCYGNQEVGACRFWDWYNKYPFCKT